MILNTRTDEAFSVKDAIPSAARVGNVAIWIGGIRRHRGILVVVQQTAVAGAGSTRLRIYSGLTAGPANTAYLSPYATAIGDRYYLIYPGNGSPATSGFVASENMRLGDQIGIQIENSSAVPGDECTVKVSFCLLP